MKLDTELFIAALADEPRRPRARAHLQAFLAAGGAPNVSIRQRYSASASGEVSLLSAAAEHGWDEAVENLLAAGADMHASDDQALRWAAARGHLSVVQRLLAAGADVHVFEDSALRWAARNGHRSVVERLLAAGADVSRAAMAHSIENKQMICSMLDAVAAAIPPEQRQQLLAMNIHPFPALRALCAADQRRSAPHHGTPRHRDLHP